MVIELHLDGKSIGDFGPDPLETSVRCFSRRESSRISPNWIRANGPLVVELH